MREESIRLIGELLNTAHKAAEGGVTVIGNMICLHLYLSILMFFLLSSLL